MIKFLTALFILAVTSTTQAFVVRTELKVMNNDLQKQFSIQCSNDETFCDSLCQHPSSCTVPETLCEDCATNSSPVLYTVFKDLTGIFKSEFSVIQDEQLVTFLKTKKFMTLSYDLFLNFFTPEKKDALKKQFESLCYIQDPQNALLISTLNEKNQIDELVGVICQDQTQKSVVLPIQLNPDFSNQRSDFWSRLNQDAGSAVHHQVLKLKMTEELP